MAKRTTIQAYNATISAIKRATGVSQREAQQVYRTASVRLGRAPTASEAKRSTAIKQEAKRAGAQLRAKERAREKAVEKAIEKSRQTGRGKKTVEIPPRRPPGHREPPGRGGDRGGAGGAPGGRGRRFTGPAEAVEYEEGVEIEDFGDTEYEEKYP